MKKRIITIILSLLLCTSIMLGCSNKMYALPYYDLTDPIRGYDKNMFTYNELIADGPDPSLIQITDPEDPDYGWFYVYPTTGDCVSIGAYRSRDMQQWESVGTVYVGVEGSCARDRIWAPECIYDENTDRYYLFFSAADYFCNPEIFPQRELLNDGGVYSYPSFETYDDREKYFFYQDYVFEKFAVTNPTKQDIALVVNELQLRIALLLKMGVGVDVVDGIEGGYTTKYKQEDIDFALSVYEELDLDAYNGDSELTAEVAAETYKEAKKTLVATYAPEITVFPHEVSSRLFVAVSDSPRGPFLQYTNEEGKVNAMGDAYNPTQRTLDLSMPYIAQEDVYKWLKYHVSDYYKGTNRDFYIDENGEKQPSQMIGDSSTDINEELSCEMIDISPFIDPKTGDKYIYAIRGPNAAMNSLNFIFGIKIGDKNSKWTDDPMWETTTRLTRTHYYTTDDLAKSNNSKMDLEEGYSNEGPHMYYDAVGDNYYLTMSLNGWNSPDYSVIQAIGKSPLGPFRKLSRTEGGVLLASEPGWDHVAGPGHHSFCTFNGKLYVAYHDHPDTNTGQGPRHIAVDEVVFVENENGLRVMHVNGPTKSFMPKMGPDMPYKNIATEATVTATNVEEYSDVSYLTDGVIRIYSFDYFISEFETGDEETTEITLTFDDYRSIAAIMVFNSVNFVTHFKKVDRIEFDFKRTLENGRTEKGTAYINDLAFDMNRYSNEEKQLMRPGGSAIAQFYEMQVKEIRLTFTSETTIAISEIYVLGK